MPFSSLKTGVLALVIVLCCFCLGACAHHGGTQTQVNANPPLNAPTFAPRSTVWVTVQDSTELAGTGENLRSLLVALLQSDTGMSIADNAENAAYLLHIQVVQIGLTTSEHVGMNMSEGFGSAATGAVLGLGVGSGFGGNGAAWGAGAGVLVGLGVGYAMNGSNNADTWAMLADVELREAKGTIKKDVQQVITQSRMAVIAEGVNLTREDAIPPLEDALAQEIVKYFKKESS